MSAQRDQPIGDSPSVPPCAIGAANVGFETARAMPPSVYTSPDLLALEQAAHVSPRVALRRPCQCDPAAGRLPHADIDGQPIVVLRDRDGVVRAFSNVCLHRMSVLLEGRGHVHGGIVCPYHAWTYTFDGTLHGAPHMERSGFCKESYRLPELRGRDVARLDLRHARRHRSAGRREARAAHRSDRQLRND